MPQLEVKTINRISRYLKDPRPDLLPALRLLLGPQCKMPIWDFIKYLFDLGGSRLLGQKRALFKAEGEVSFETYMTAYDKTSATYHPYRQLLARVAQLVDAKPGGKVADLGSGTGNLSCLVAKSGATVYSFDRSAEVNRMHWRKRPEAIIFPVDLDRPDSQTNFTSLADASLDGVCAANVWTYIKNVRSLYAEIRRVLKPEGFLVLSVERQGYDPLAIVKAHVKHEFEAHLRAGLPLLTAAVSVYRDLFAHTPELLIAMQETKKLMRGIAIGDYRVYTESEIRQELADNGFEILSCEAAMASQCLVLKARPLH